jgi:hypothetical protein
MNIGLLAANAAKAYLTALSPALTTVTNFYSELEDPDNADSTAKTRLLPCVICFFGGAQEYPIGTGNYSGELSIQVQASADDTTALEFAAIYDEVWSKISTDTILADLGAAGTNLTAFGFTGGIQQTAQTLDQEHRLRIKSMILPINCCPSDVS